MLFYFRYGKSTENRVAPAVEVAKAESQRGRGASAWHAGLMRPALGKGSGYPQTNPHKLHPRRTNCIFLVSKGRKCAARVARSHANAPCRLRHLAPSFRRRARRRWSRRSRASPPPGRVHAEGPETRCVERFRNDDSVRRNKRTGFVGSPLSSPPPASARSRRAFGAAELVGGRGTTGQPAPSTSRRKCRVLRSV